MVSGLTSGVTYKFKVQSRNSFGLSSYSAIASILCAFVPNTPIAPSSHIDNSNTIITWTEPSNNGSPVTAYTVTIKNSVGNFISDLTHCNGVETAIVAAT